MREPNGVARIVLADDDESVLHNMKVALQLEGFPDVVAVSDSQKVAAVISESRAALLVLDLVMPHKSGMEVLEEVTASSPWLPVIVVTAMDDVDSAVKCMKAGAFDYLVKPLERDRLVAAVRRALRQHYLEAEVSKLKASLLGGGIKNPSAFASLVTASPAMKSIFQYAEAVAPSPHPILITGETGVGKELLARAIHHLSGVRGAFVAINVAEPDDQLFSDALFGHGRGAFTGAESRREGLIARAAGGTIFLDEIGELASASQAKLLRLLQEHEYYPLGSDVPHKSDARVIVSTNRELASMVGSGGFRQDLYYRLVSHQIEIPPLRKRLEDIPALVAHLVECTFQEMNRKPCRVPSELYSLLSTYHFPGNVRELQAMIRDAVAQCKSNVIPLGSFRKYISRVDHAPLPSRGDDAMSLTFSFDRFPAQAEIDRFFTLEALKAAGGNQGIAAGLLGITRQAMNRRLKKLNERLRPPDA